MVTNLLFWSTLLSCEEKPDSLVGDSDRPLWDPDINSPPLMNNDYPSSSALSFSWTPPLESISHYQITLESQGSVIQEQTIESTSSSFGVTALRSATEYAFSLVACLDEACSEHVEADPENLALVSATHSEVWRFLGSPDNASEIYTILPAGADTPSVLSFGESAPEEFSGRILLSYVDHTSPSLRGVRFAELNRLSISESTITETDILITDNFGLSNIEVSVESNRSLSSLSFTSAQMKPMIFEDGLGIRLFTTASANQEPEQLFSINSADGFKGLDYSAAETTFCSTSEEYNSADHCLLEDVLIPDASLGTLPMASVEQFQLGWEIIDRSNLGVDSTPIMIVQGTSPCQDESSASHLYSALFNTADGQWEMQLEDDCPEKLVDQGNNPSLVNYNSGQMKLYYYSAVNEAFQLLYLDQEDGSYDPTQLESSEMARDIIILPPAGEEVDTSLVSQLRQVHVFIPPADVVSDTTGSSPQQMMLVTLPAENGDSTQGVGMATLLNP